MLDQCEQMPDCEMMESVFTVDKLTQGQLNALLAGEVEYNDEIIISPNFYASIVTACNYLQFTNPKKFVEFSLAILDNPELYATHEYIANRISRVTSKEVYAFFKAVLANSDRATKRSQTSPINTLQLTTSRKTANKQKAGTLIPAFYII